MATFDFDTVAETTVTFDALIDVLYFSSSWSAAGLSFEISGNDLIVSNLGTKVRLAATTYSKLGSANFSFLNESVALFGTNENDLLSGSDFADYFDLSRGGSDNVSGGLGSDIFVAGTALTTADTIAGGDGYDEIRMAGPTSVAFNAATVTEVELLTVLDGVVSLTLASTTVTTASDFTVDASGQTQGSSLSLNGAAVLSNGFNARGGAGSDSLIGGGGGDSLEGGDEADTLLGGGGNDTLRGGLGEDVLTGGAGADDFVQELANGPRSESSPVTPDRVTDFSLIAGDRLDLPGTNLFGLPVAFKAGSVNFQFLGIGISGEQLPVDDIDDGLADVTWKFVANEGSNGRFHVWLDANDDGQFSEGDILVYLDRAAGETSEILTRAAFSERLLVVKGTAGPDTLTGGAGNDTIYAVGGADSVSGLGGFDQLFGGDGNDTLLGGDDGDQVFGGSGADSLLGGDGSDGLYGGSGNDALEGGNDADALYAEYDSADAVDARNLLRGEAGNDQLYGGAGLDTLDGGSDDDYLSGGEGDDSLLGADGQDYLDGGGGDDTLLGGSEQDTLRGGTGVDSLTGGTAADEFQVTQGETTLAATDLITDFSTAEGDKLNIGSFYTWGRPLVWRGATAAQATPTAGLALPDGGLGTGFTQVWWVPSLTAGGWVVVDSDDNQELNANDYVLRIAAGTIGSTDFVADTFTVQLGTAGPDTLTGGAGNDTIYAVGGADSVSGLGGSDQLFGGDGNDTLLGGDDGDQVFGGSGADSLLGGDGGDGLYGGAGNDTLAGGNDADVLWADADGTDAVDARNLLRGEAGNDALYGGEGLDTLEGGSDDDELQGAGGDDSLVGADGQDNLEGGEGDDTLLGGAGQDTLRGWTGVDSLTGGTAADEFRVMQGDTTLAATDLITDFSTAEGDKLNIGSFYTWGRPLVWRGATAAQATPTAGLALPDGGLGTGFTQVWWVPSLTAGGWVVVDSDDNQELNANDYVLRIAAGTIGSTDFVADTFTVQLGTAGPDTLTGGAGNDTIYAVGGADSVSGLGGSDQLFGGDGNDTLLGGDDGDQVFGGSGADSLLGGDGGDGLYGGAGNDTLAGGNDADVLWADADGTDAVDARNLLRGEAGNDALYGGEGLDTLEGGSDDDELQGAGGDDSLVGADGQDNLEGGEGDDTLLGGAGQDTLRGWTGVDSLTGGTAADEFRVTQGETTLAATDLITDFSTAEGDKLNIGSFYTWGRPLVWRGATAAQATPTAGLALPDGGLGTGFTQVWWVPSLTAGGWVVVDSDDNQELNANDYVLRIAAGTIGSTDFVADTFTARLGTAGPDTLTGGAGNDTIYAVGGADSVSGLGGSDVLYGGDGSDTLLGGNDGDQVFGGSGADSLLGGDGSDGLYGGSGNDTLEGGNDADVLYADADGTDAVDARNLLLGGAGGDRLYGGAGLDTLDGGSDDDSLEGAGGDDSLVGADGQDYLDGGEGNDTLLGGSSNDTLDGGEGDDVIVYDAADATVTGGDDFDRLVLLEAFDVDLGNAADQVLGGGIATGFEAVDASALMASLRLVGSTGANLFLGGSGNDTLSGGGGNDTLHGNAGADSLSGEAGNDTFYVDTLDTVQEAVGGGKDVVYASANFTLTAGQEIEEFRVSGAAGLQLVGNERGNEIYGGSGNDTLNGAGGADVLVGNGGTDLLIGGGDNDTYYVDGLDTVQEAVGGGTDTVFTSVSFTLGAGQEVEVLRALSGAVGLRLTGNELANTVLSDAGADTLSGGAGNDTLSGGSGNDVLFGDAGADSLSGGTGNDTYYVDALDTVREAVGGGTDTVLASANFTLTAGQEIEVLQALAGAVGLRLTGNELANTILGEALADTLSGGGGNDTLSGSGGNDVLYGDAGADSLSGGAGNDTYYVDALDTVVEAVGGGRDVVYATASFTLTAGQEVEEFRVSGATGLQLVGNERGGEIYGGSGNDTLNGAAGADVLIGNGGADLLIGGADNDTFYVDALDTVQEAVGGGTDTVLASSNFTLGAGQEIEVLRALSGAVGLRLAGNELANTILGEALADTLSGGGGNDTLSGGGGNDILTGDAGADSLSGGTGNDTYYVDALDTVQEAVGGGRDVVFALANFTLGAGQEIEELRGAGGGLQLVGNERGNEIYGGSGNDTLNGAAGADVLVGNGGADLLIGGADNDTFYVDALDTVQEAVGGGTDAVFASANFTLGAGQEIEVLRAMAGAVGLRLTGNELANTVLGEALADTLSGGGGNDTLSSGGGNDILTGDAGADSLSGGTGNDTYYVDGLDTVREAIGGGTDTVLASDNFTLTAGQEIEVLQALAGAGGLRLTGNELANTVLGEALADTLSGGGGNDTLSGSGGNDVLYGDAGADSLSGGTGNDTYYVDGLDTVQEAVGGGRDVVFATVSFTLTAGQEIEELRGFGGGLQLVGNDRANEIYGGSGNDTLNGAAGADVLVGNGGADRLIGGAGVDTLYGGAGQDVFFLSNLAADRDVLSDFVGGTDFLQVSVSAFGGGLVVGSLAGNQFLANATGLAGDADDRFIYNTSSGILFYDLDGAGAGGPVQIATLSGVPNLAASDFILVA